MSALWLCGMTGAGKEANLRALINPIAPFFAGLQWTYHYPLDNGSMYLHSMCGKGRIVYVHFSARHGSSMTQYLHQGTMVEGDHFVQIDDLERLSVGFCRDELPALIGQMKAQNIAMISNYGKGLIYRFNDQLEFKGSPHWWASGLDGNAANIELPQTAFWNVRAEQRDPFQFVTHYLKYYVAYPAGSNHCLLGLEKNGDPQKLFPEREARRLAFRKALAKRGYELTVDGVIHLMKTGLGIDSEIESFFKTEKILNDAYRYLHLGRTDFVDNHDFKDMIPVP